MFWSPARRNRRRSTRARLGVWARRRAWSLPTAALVVATLVIAFAAGPIFSFCERTAHDLNRPAAYTSVVLGR